jgi:hypothetical protein
MFTFSWNNLYVEGKKVLVFFSDIPTGLMRSHSPPVWEQEKSETMADTTIINTTGTTTANQRREVLAFRISFNLCGA